MSQGINSFKDLIVWQKSHQFALQIFVLSKKTNKNGLNYEIWRQLLRAVFSVPANIVEGVNSHKGKNYLSHLEIARGSAAESLYWLIVLKEIGDLKEKEYQSLESDCEEVSKMLSKMISTLSTRHYPLPTVH